MDISLPAALAGALVGAFVSGALAPVRIGGIGSTRWGAGAVGAVGFAAVMAFCLPTHTPSAARATVTLDRAAGSGRALATVAFHPASVVSQPDYVQQPSWQGHTISLVAILRRVRPGVYRTTKALPLTGTWKSLIRVQQGRMRADARLDRAREAARVDTSTRVSRSRALSRKLTLESNLFSSEHGGGSSVTYFLNSDGRSSCSIFTHFIELVLGRTGKPSAAR